MFRTLNTVWVTVDGVGVDFACLGFLKRLVNIVPFAGDEQVNVSPTAACNLDANASAQSQLVTRS